MYSPILRSDPENMVIRKLKDIAGELEPLAKQGKIEGFFSNVKNADKLGGLVDDIRDAIIQYQVRPPNSHPPPQLMFAIDIVATGYL
jgi:hypothetical protein